MGALHSWLLTLKNALPAQPVEDAEDHDRWRHAGSMVTACRPALPCSANLGGGKYRVDGMKFTMSGWWELRFAITAAAGSDSAVFNVTL